MPTISLETSGSSVTLNTGFQRSSSAAFFKISFTSSHARVARRYEGHVGDRTGNDRHAQLDAIEFTDEFRNGFRHRDRSACRGWHDVMRARATVAKIFFAFRTLDRPIDQILRRGVAVRRIEDRFFDPDRSRARIWMSGLAALVVHDALEVMTRVFEFIIVDADKNCRARNALRRFVFDRRSNDDALRARVEMCLCFFITR